MMCEPWYMHPAARPSEVMREQAEQRQLSLTKPPGALGQLERLAVHLASLQHRPDPQINTIAISIFAADHGIAEENVSAFPQAVTAEMIKNFASGGAAISVLSRFTGATLRVANLGTVSVLPAIASVDDNRIAAGTANFLKYDAMTGEQLSRALAVGKQHVDDAISARQDLFIAGEMGIANTCVASALACALLQQPAKALVGPGTGIDGATQLHKMQVIEKALLARGLQGQAPNPLMALQAVGGFEIAALTGAYLRAGQVGLAVLVDGFITSVAALAAVMIQPAISPWLLLSHQSAEPGHQCIIDQLTTEFGLPQPLFKLDMRLGEASGAATAVPLLQAACHLHNEMATFASAGVSEKQSPAL